VDSDTKLAFNKQHAKLSTEFITFKTGSIRGMQYTLYPTTDSIRKYGKSASTWGSTHYLLTQNCAPCSTSASIQKLRILHGKQARDTPYPPRRGYEGTSIWQSTVV